MKTDNKDTKTCENPERVNYNAEPHIRPLMAEVCHLDLSGPLQYT